MIITRAPFRISFFGGGSDLPSFYSQSPGRVVSTTIDQYMYISIHPFFHRDRYQIKYSRTENVRSLEEIRHPIVRAALGKLGVGPGWEITSTADVPAGTGLGSSSSFTVALLHALHVAHGRFAPPEQLAAEACEIEIEELGEPIGKQDQYAAAVGGLNELVFQPSGDVTVQRIVLDRESRDYLDHRLVAFYTGDSRRAGSILAEQRRSMRSDRSKFEAVRELAAMAAEARELLVARRFEAFGRMLDRAWRVKRGLARGMSNDRVGEIYKRGMDAGALGGKLLGAGGGGFLLFYCPRARADRLRRALGGLQELEFHLQEAGSTVVHVSEPG